jgi:GNAT superfamily N-acetyltransferase
MALLADELGYPTDSRTLRERLALLLGRSDYLIAVAEAEAGRVCGWIQAQSSLALESGFRVEIVGLVVSKAMQRRGIGRLLVGHAEAWAGRMGAEAIVVRSKVQRQESHPFYVALGYACTKTQNVYRKRII